MCVLICRVWLLSLGVRMRSEGYSSQFVCLFVCLSVASVRSTLLARKLKVWCQQVANGVFFSFNVTDFCKRICFRSYANFCLPRWRCSSFGRSLHILKRTIACKVDKR